MRILQRDLNALVDKINRKTGSALAPYRKIGVSPDRHTANVGHYCLDYAYGGVKLVRIVNASGGQETISNGGYGAKRELYTEMQAFLAGLDAAKEKVA